ncbi:MAG TPA: J domain-containing protein [Telluria sp.]
MSPWDILCIEPTGDQRDIKRAYARLLKGARPEDDPAAFQELRDAYEYALNEARYAAAEASGAQGEPDAPDAYEDRAFGPFAIARLQPAVDAPALARPDPEQEAQRLWSNFLGTAELAPRNALAQLAAGDDLLDLEVRECFELCAVRHCAGADCPDPVREALADFFQWQTDAALIAREALEETREMLARLRAAQSLALFQQQAANEPAVQAILSDQAGRNFGRTLDAKFTMAMRELVGAIRYQHPDMLYFKLDSGVFEAWERRVEGRRYFLQTALQSAIAGGALWLVTMVVLIWLDLQREYTLVSLIACQLLAFTVIGWLVVSPSAALAQALARWRLGFYYLLQDVRQPRWQFGWIGLYLMAAACLSIPHPPLLVEVVVTAALLAALAGALFANAGVLNGWGHVISAIVGIALGLHWAKQQAEGYGAAAWMAAVMCGMQLMYRGGADFCQWLELPEQRLPRLRAGWLAGAAGLLALTHQLALPLPAAVLATFVWLTAGMLLSNPSIHHFLPYLGAVMIRTLVLDKAPVVLPSPMPGLSIGLIVVATFMLVNMARANKNQHHFS